MEIKEVILVDEADQPVGRMEKLEAHREGVLHRAFSIFIFNSVGQMLLQRRALEKYHSGGLWTNACCSHPEPGETTAIAAKRRLQEEMGIVTTIEEIFDFTYTASFSNGLIENEFDHVFAGEYDGPVFPDPQEAMEFRFEDVRLISRSVDQHPELYSAWFRLAFPRIENWWTARYKNMVA